MQQNGDDIIGEIETQANRLNSGDSGSGTPPTCEWTDTEGNTRTGHYRWVEPSLGHQEWGELMEVNPDVGTVYRYECWDPAMINPDGSCAVQDADVGDRCLGEIEIDTFCGDFLCTFDAINPQNLALLAVDRFLRTLGPPDPAFSPDAEEGETLVNFDTWRWVTNVGANGAQGPWTMSVPGQSVSAGATLEGIEWDMGDGEGPEVCPIVTSEAEAQSVCPYNYLRSSAGQPDDAYQGTVTANWQVVWQGEVLGQAVSGEFDAPRVGEFAATVSEAQALNTDGE